MIKNFFRQIGQSVWSPQFYAGVSGRPIKSGFKYLAALSCLTALATVIIACFLLIPVLNDGLAWAVNWVEKDYPADLVVNIKNGVAETSVERVYAMELPKDFFGKAGQNREPVDQVKNILVIDTSSNFQNIKQFESVSTMALLTKDALVVYDDRGIKVNPLKDIKQLTVDKKTAVYWVSKLASILKSFMPVLFGLAFVVFFAFSYVYYILAALITGLLMWAIGAMTKRGGQYKNYLSASLNAVTLAILLDVLLFLFGNVEGLSMTSIVLLSLIVWCTNIKIWLKPGLPSTSVNEPPMTT